MMHYVLIGVIVLLCAIGVAVTLSDNNKANDILMKVATAVVVIGFLTILFGQ